MNKTRTQFPCWRTNLNCQSQSTPQLNVITRKIRSNYLLCISALDNNISRVHSENPAQIHSSNSCQRATPPPPPGNIHWRLEDGKFSINSSCKCQINVTFFQLKRWKWNAAINWSESLWNWQKLTSANLSITFVFQIHTVCLFWFCTNFDY